MNEQREALATGGAIEVFNSALMHDQMNVENRAPVSEQPNDIFFVKRQWECSTSQIAADHADHARHLRRRFACLNRD
jgi:hypothetical protein